MIRPKATVRSNRSSPTKPLAIAQINAGINIIARVVSINSINAKPPKASFAKAEAFSFFSYFFEINGTKAELKAPSAKNLLNIFGNLKAAKKASRSGPAPIRENNKISRTMPKTRLTKVQKPTVKKPDITRMGFKILPVPLQA